MNPAGAVSVTLPPAQNVVGPLAVTVGVAGVGFTATFTGLPVVLQPAAVVTVAVSVIDAAPEFAWKNAAAPLAMVESITPPLMVQLYVALVPASGTLAEPPEPAQMAAAVVIVASGAGLTVKMAASLVVLVQPTESVTET